ncbi:DUF3263 domain-containing protein [Paenarthrobacter sp. NPDC089714]|uniref:DUF3263 domain-containing protein n=1 Tax=Paenarthrobacter sp. NPDC089714 TaxID=3364377 RepID=UPI0037F6A6A4
MLSDHEKAMIDLAGEQFKYAGSLDSAAMDRFGMTPTKYRQEINRLIRTESAAYKPAVVARLNRARRPQARTVSRLAGVTQNPRM